MKKFLFLMTHIGAKTENFISNITSNPDIEFFPSQDDWMYDNFDSFNYLSKQSHKAAHAAAIYMDEIKHNFKFQRNMILPNCNFIFYLDEPRSSIHKIVKDYGEKEGVRYYTYRLQGLYEYIIRTKGVVSTWNNWNIDQINKTLSLRNPIIDNHTEEAVEKDIANYESVLKAERVYEDLVFKIKTFNKI